MAAKSNKDFIPALGFRILTPIYDPVLKWCLKDERFKKVIVKEIGNAAEKRILDLGCGTGTLSLMIKEAYPQHSVTGIDIDPQVLKYAENKAAKKSLDIAFSEGSAYHLPYENASFDHIVSSLVIHHLDPDRKLEAVKESFRVLVPGGIATFLDFGVPQSSYSRLVSKFIKYFEKTDDLIAGKFPGMLEDAGFAEISIPEYFPRAIGTFSLYTARKPA